MKRIILLRHAKSSWNHPGLSDHDRPLNKRGKAAAPDIGAWMQQNGYVPDVILCSTATRTRETVARLGLSDEIPVEFSKDLYHADESQLLEALNGVDGRYDCAMLIGHQPGMGSFAELLSADVAPHCAQAFDHFPTAAAAVFQSEVNVWKGLGAGQAAFIDFAKPRDLVVQ